MLAGLSRNALQEGDLRVGSLLRSRHFESKAGLHATENLQAIRHPRGDLLKSRTPIAFVFSSLLAITLLAALSPIWAGDDDDDRPRRVRLESPAAPSVGEPGVTIIAVNGSHFPEGNIPPTNVTVRIVPAVAGTGPSGTTLALTVTRVRRHDDDDSDDRDKERKDGKEDRDEDKDRDRDKDKDKHKEDDDDSTRRVTFLIPSSIVVSVPTAYQVSISGTTSRGKQFASINTASLTINPHASISLLVPNTGQVGQNLSVTITGSFTNFVQGSTQASFGPGISVGGGPQGGFGPSMVSTATSATAQLMIDATASAGPRTVTVRTGAEQASLVGGFTVVAGLSITDFNPKSASIGTLVNVTGSNFVSSSGGSPQVTLNKQGGGTIPAPVAAFTVTSIAFVVPTGADTGPVTVTAAGKSVTSASPLTIVASSNFTLSATPNAANVIRGQSTTYAVSLSSNSGFSQLAALSVAGLPTGLTATFTPPQITAGQTSLLTVTAPANQNLGTATLTVSASAVVDGIPISQSATVALNVQPVT